jgi:hypothetical protein
MHNPSVRRDYVHHFAEESSDLIPTGGLLAFFCAKQQHRPRPGPMASMSQDIAPAHSYYRDWQVPAACNKTYIPRGIALSPSFLQHDIRKMRAVPDRLLVVARHNEVCLAGAQQ